MWKPVRRKIPPKYEIWWWKTQRVGNRVRSPIKDILLAKRLKHPPIRRSQLVVGIGHGRTHSVSLKVMRKTLVDAMTHCSCCSSSAFLWSFSQNFSQSLRIAPFCFSEIFWKSLVGEGNVVETQRTHLNCCDKCNLKPFQTMILPFESGNPELGSPKRKICTWASAWHEV